MRQMSTLQQRLTRAEAAAADTAQRLAARCAEVDAAKAAADVARRDAASVRSELRVQQDATAQVRC